VPDCFLGRSGVNELAFITLGALTFHEKVAKDVLWVRSEVLLDTLIIFIGDFLIHLESP
jgi:hypothetical protein